VAELGRWLRGHSRILSTCQRPLFGSACRIPNQTPTSLLQFFLKFHPRTCSFTYHSVCLLIKLQSHFKIETEEVLFPLLRYQNSILEQVARCAASWLSRLRTIQNGQSLRATEAFAPVIDLMGMAAAADVILAHLVDGNPV
jgi:hypothetical protein